MERSRAAGLVAGALALVLAGVLAWLWRTGGPGGAGAARPAARPPAAAAGARPVALDGEAGLEAGRTAVAADPRDAEDSPAAERVFEAPLAEGVPIRVLRGLPGEPVPFAEVAYTRSAPDSPLLRLEQRAGHGAYDHRAGAPAWYRADADGRLFLPASSGDAVATCAHGGDFGLLYVGSGTDEVLELRLHPDRALVVRVVRGGEREPVPDALVGVRYRLGPDSGEILRRARTGPDGRVRFEHARDLTGWYWPHTEELAAVLLGVFREPSAAAFDPEAPPDELELVMPPVSRLEVEVVGPDGALARDPVLVLAAIDGVQGAETPSEVATGGRAVFDQVEPDVAVTLWADRAVGGEGSKTVIARSAPAGQTARAVVRLEGPDLVLVARLLEDGVPLAERDVLVSLFEVPSPVRSALGARTDAEGRLRCELDMRIAGGSDLELKVALARSDEPRAVHVPLVGPLQPGELALGDLELGIPPRIAAGRVVDAAGAPVAGAWVYARLAAEGRVRGFTLSSARSGKDGSFAVYGTCRAGAVSLQARHAAFGPQPAREVAVGASGVELVMEGDAGRLRGSVLFDAEWLADFCRVRARPAGAAEWTHDTVVERPGVFELGGLAPGRWDVGVCMENERRTPVVVSGVEVEAGAVADDPRLQAIDLRGIARLLTLTVVDEAGEPVDDGQVWTRPAGEARWDDFGWIEAGAAHLFTTQEALDVYFDAEGYRTAFVPAVRAPREVVLSAGVPVRLHWSEPPPKTPADVAFYATLRIQEQGMPQIERWISIEDEPGEGEVVVLPAAGRVHLAWRRGEKSGPGWSFAGEPLLQPFDVPDRLETQDLGVAMPPEMRARVEAPAAGG